MIIRGQFLHHDKEKELLENEYCHIINQNSMIYWTCFYYHILHKERAEVVTAMTLHSFNFQSGSNLVQDPFSISALISDCDGNLNNWLNLN